MTAAYPGDPGRDAAALVRAVLDHDDDGRDAILAGADHEDLAVTLARMLVLVLRGVGSEASARRFLDLWQAITVADGD